MALFGRGKRGESADAVAAAHAPIPGREAFCRVCDGLRRFSTCWRRSGIMVACPGCGASFENPAAIYGRRQPTCPRCEEPLESPGFEYGVCEGCGSKYELADGARPALLPNKKQRDAMNVHGRSWSKP